MSGRHKFSELEVVMGPARRARVRQMTEKLEADVARAEKRALTNPSDADLADATADTRQKVVGS